MKKNDIFFNFQPNKDMSDKLNDEEKKWQNLAINSFAMALSGIAFGWMLGMSVTPVIKEVIGTFLLLFAGIMALIAGIEKISIKPPTNDGETSIEVKGGIEIGKYIWKVNLLPIGCFMSCMAYGASRGLYMKNNHIFNTDYRKMANSFGIADSTFNKNYNTILFERGIGVFLTEQNTITLKNNLEKDSSKVIIKKDGHKVYIVEKPKTPPIQVDGLKSKPTSRRECDVASTYSADVLKDWLLSKVKLKADSIRISQIPIKNEVKLKNELQKICSRK